jgi:hypothetical protein
MNEILKDIVFKAICLFGMIYLLYRVGSFLVQATRNLARYSKTHAKTPHQLFAQNRGISGQAE